MSNDCKLLTSETLPLSYTLYIPVWRLCQKIHVILCMYVISSGNLQIITIETEVCITDESTKFLTGENVGVWCFHGFWFDCKNHLHQMQRQIFKAFKINFINFLMICTHQKFPPSKTCVIEQWFYIGFHFGFDPDCTITFALVKIMLV